MTIKAFVLTVAVGVSLFSLSSVCVADNKEPETMPYANKKASYSAGGYKLLRTNVYDKGYNERVDIYRWYDDNDKRLGEIKPCWGRKYRQTVDYYKGSTIGYIDFDPKTGVRTAYDTRYSPELRLGEYDPSADLTTTDYVNRNQIPFYFSYLKIRGLPGSHLRGNCFPELYFVGYGVAPR